MPRTGKATFEVEHFKDEARAAMKKDSAAMRMKLEPDCEHLDPAQSMRRNIDVRRATSMKDYSLDQRKTFLTEVSTFVLPDEDVLLRLWQQYDYNGNGMLSLAEIDKFIVEQFPELNVKRALMRAYKFADADSSGLITRAEFTLLLRSLVYFKQLDAEFSAIDRDNDRRISVDELMHSGDRLQRLGLGRLRRKDVRALFKLMDADGEGMILFDEFCSYLSRLRALEATERRKAMEDAARGGTGAAYASLDEAAPAAAGEGPPPGGAAADGAAADGAAADGAAADGARAPLALAREPAVLRLLLATMFEPGRRASGLALERCGEVVACVTLAADDDGAAAGAEPDAESARAEVERASAALCEAATICADPLTISFRGQQQGVAERLLERAALPACALGILLWLRALLHDRAFLNSAAYLAFAPTMVRGAQSALRLARARD